MEFKQVPSKLYYCVEKVLTIPEIAEFAGKTSESLYQDALAKELGIIGPVGFIYLNCGEYPKKAVRIDHRHPS